MALAYETVAAAGSSQATATELKNRYATVTGADGSVGVRLSGAFPGNEFRVYNATATNGLKVYPHVGGDINDGTQDASVTIEGKSYAIFSCMDGVTWGAIYTVDT